LATSRPSNRCCKHSSRSSCTFQRDLSIEQSSGRQFLDLRARAESGTHTRSARDTMREDDRVVVSRPEDLAPVEQTGREALAPNGSAPACSWRTQNYLFPTWQDELALQQVRWSAGTSTGRRSQRGSRCVAQTFGKHKRIAKRALQYHFPARSIIRGVEYLQRLPRPAKTFS
jgi:hypothetical protein